MPVNHHRRKLRLVAATDIAVGDQLHSDGNPIDVWAVKVWRGWVDVTSGDGQHHRYRTDTRHRVLRTADRRRR